MKVSAKIKTTEVPLAGGGRNKYTQVVWLSPIHGAKATALKGPLCEVDARV